MTARAMMDRILTAVALIVALAVLIVVLVEPSGQKSPDDFIYIGDADKLCRSKYGSTTWTCAAAPKGAR